MQTHTCPLCQSADTAVYHEDKKRAYFICEHCRLVFVPTHFHLSEADEKSEYDKHENALDDPGYLRFLRRTLDPLASRLVKPQSGLDFGCGPTPLLAHELKALGHSVSIYDRYYANDAKVLQLSYDFITCTEVIEHIAEPEAVFERFKKLLKPKGILAIMTKRVLDVDAFKTWHYKNDPTHICFYSEFTFEWVAKHWQWTLEIVDKDVVFLTAP